MHEGRRHEKGRRRENIDSKETFNSTFHIISKKKGRQLKDGIAQAATTVEKIIMILRSLTAATAPKNDGLHKP